MNKYRRGVELGTGTFAHVYKATSILDNREVSIKMIRFTEFYDDAMAKNEIDALSKLKHDNVVQFFESFKDGDFFCIVMEFCEGRTLQKFISEQKQPLPEHYVLNLFSQMVAALKYCHEQKVMHRDLKSENIILTPNNQIKLIDFGVAKVLKDDATLASTLAGTPCCMAPEIINGKQYSFPCDIWSLGIIIYELLTFKKPFLSKNQPDLKKQICCEFIPEISSNYSSDLIGMVQAMLMKDPFTRIKLNKILKHPTLWNLKEDLTKKVGLLERELKEQKDLVEKLHKEIDRLKYFETENQNLQNENQRLKSVETENQNLQNENQRLKSVETENEKEIERLQKRYTHKFVDEGMELLRHKTLNEDAQSAAFFLFKIAADEDKDPEAIWRVAACYLIGIGIGKDQVKALEYSKIAFASNLTDGIFWYAMCLDDDDEKFQYFQQAANGNHLAAQYFVGFCTFKGYGTVQNESEGTKIMQNFFENQKDLFWTTVYIFFCQDEKYNLHVDQQKIDMLSRQLNSLPMCDSSYFTPYELQEKC
jgi:NIMA (never in mitosis gene a)-related kinase